MKRLIAFALALFVAATSIAADFPRESSGISLPAQNQVLETRNPFESEALEAVLVSGFRHSTVAATLCLLMTVAGSLHGQRHHVNPFASSPAKKDDDTTQSLPLKKSIKTPAAIDTSEPVVTAQPAPAVQSSQPTPQAQAQTPTPAPTNAPKATVQKSPPSPKTPKSSPKKSGSSSLGKLFLFIVFGVATLGLGTGYVLKRRRRIAAQAPTPPSLNWWRVLLNDVLSNTNGHAGFQPANFETLAIRLDKVIRQMATHTDDLSNGDSRGDRDQFAAATKTLAEETLRLLDKYDPTNSETIMRRDNMQRRLQQLVDFSDASRRLNASLDGFLALENMRWATSKVDSLENRWGVSRREVIASVNACITIGNELSPHLFLSGEEANSLLGQLDRRLEAIPTNPSWSQRIGSLWNFLGFLFFSALQKRGWRNRKSPAARGHGYEQSVYRAKKRYLRESLRPVILPDSLRAYSLDVVLVLGGENTEELKHQVKEVNDHLRRLGIDTPLPVFFYEGDMPPGLQNALLARTYIEEHWTELQTDPAFSHLRNLRFERSRWGAIVASGQENQMYYPFFPTPFDWNGDFAESGKGLSYFQLKLLYLFYQAEPFRRQNAQLAALTGADTVQIGPQTLGLLHGGADVQFHLLAARSTASQIAFANQVVPLPPTGQLASLHGADVIALTWDAQEKTPRATSPLAAEIYSLRSGPDALPDTLRTLDEQPDPNNPNSLVLYRYTDTAFIASPPTHLLDFNHVKTDAHTTRRLDSWEAEMFLFQKIATKINALVQQFPHADILIRTHILVSLWVMLQEFRFSLEKYKQQLLDEARSQGNTHTEMLEEYLRKLFAILLEERNLFNKIAEFIPQIAPHESVFVQGWTQSPEHAQWNWDELVRIAETPLQAEQHEGNDDETHPPTIYGGRITPLSGGIRLIPRRWKRSFQRLQMLARAA